MKAKLNKSAPVATDLFGVALGAYLHACGEALSYHN